MASEVITFRLHPDNPDERRALNILRDLERKGYDRRYIGMAGLLALAGVELPAPGDVRTLSDFRNLLDELDQLVTQAARIGFAPGPGQAGPAEPNGGPDTEVVAQLRSLVAKHNKQ